MEGIGKEREGGREEGRKMEGGRKRERESERERKRELLPKPYLYHIFILNIVREILDLNHEASSILVESRHIFVIDSLYGVYLFSL